MNPKEDLRLLAEITLIALGVVAFGTLSAGLVLVVASVAGPVVGFITGFVWLVLTMFAWIKLDEARG